VILRRDGDEAFRFDSKEGKKVGKDIKKLLPKTANIMLFNTGTAKLVGCSNRRDTVVIMKKIMSMISTYAPESISVSPPSPPSSSLDEEEEGEEEEDGECEANPRIAIIQDMRNTSQTVDFDISPENLVKFVVRECSDIVDVNSISFDNATKPFVSMHLNEIQLSVEKGDAWPRPVDSLVLGLAFRAETRPTYEIGTCLVGGGTRETDDVEWNHEILKTGNPFRDTVPGHTTIKVEFPNKISISTQYYIDANIKKFLKRLTENRHVLEISEDCIRKNKAAIASLLVEGFDLLEM